MTDGTYFPGSQGSAARPRIQTPPFQLQSRLSPARGPLSQFRVHSGTWLCRGWWPGVEETVLFWDMQQAHGAPHASRTPS